MFKPEDKERLVRYVDFLESELSDFSKFSRVDWITFKKDRDLQRNLERWIENIINCSIDIAKVLLAASDASIPATYREVFKELDSLHLFYDKFGEDISQWASLRNILAHQYLDIRWNSINQFLQRAEPCFRELAEKIKHVLK